MAHLNSDKDDVYASDSDGEHIPALANKVAVESSDESTESHKGHSTKKSFDSSSDSDGEGPPGLIDRHLVIYSSDESTKGEKCHAGNKSCENSHDKSRFNEDQSQIPKLIDRHLCNSSDDSSAEGEVDIPHVSSGHNSAKNNLPKLLDRNRAKVDSSDNTTKKFPCNCLLLLGFRSPNYQKWPVFRAVSKRHRRGSKPSECLAAVRRHLKGSPERVSQVTMMFET